jgi:hypothetical protein
MAAEALLWTTTATFLFLAARNHRRPGGQGGLLKRCEGCPAIPTKLILPARELVLHPDPHFDGHPCELVAIESSERQRVFIAILKPAFAAVVIHNAIPNIFGLAAIHQRVSFA